jgi:hypothetical protein
MQFFSEDCSVIDLSLGQMGRVFEVHNSRERIFESAATSELLRDTFTRNDKGCSSIIRKCKFLTKQ